MFSERIPHDVEGYEKALKSLESHLKKLPKPKDLALQKALHTFGERQTVSVRGGQKKEKVLHSRPRLSKILQEIQNAWKSEIGTGLICVIFYFSIANKFR